MPNHGDYRVWHVDSEDVCEVEPGALPTDAFYVRINKPPVLTLPEFVAWMRIGPGAVKSYVARLSLRAAKTQRRI